MRTTGRRRATLARVATAAILAWAAGGTHAQGTPSSSGGSAWQEVADVVKQSQDAIPISNADLAYIRSNADQILVLAQSCNAARCPVVEHCTHAATILQGLSDALAYLDATEAALNRAAAAAAAAQINVAGQAGISAANAGVAAETLGLKQYLGKIGAMLFDLASILDDAKNLKDANPDKVKSTFDKLDQAYETAKDLESVVNDAVTTASDLATANAPDAGTTTATPLTSGTAAVGGALAGSTPPQDSTMGLLNDLKSSLSDFRNAYKEWKELYDRNGGKLSGDMAGGIASAAGKISFRMLKAELDREIRALEDYIQDLQKNLDAEQKILGDLLRERMRMAARRDAATDARRAVAAARAALMACMARTCGLPSSTRPELPSASASWTETLRALAPLLASASSVLEIRFLVKDMCPGAGSGSSADPGTGDTGFVSSGTFQPRNVVKTLCLPCQPIADAMGKVLDEKDAYEEEARRIRRSLEQAKEIRARLAQNANEIAAIDKRIAGLKEAIAYGQTRIGNVAGPSQQDLAAAQSRRAQLVSQRSALERDLDRLEFERRRLPQIEARIEALLAKHALLHAQLRYCEEDKCRLGFFGELDTWIHIAGNDPFNPTDPLGPTVADGRPAASVSVTRGTGEGGAPGIFTIALSRPAPPGGLFIAYSLEGSAAFGIDYAAVSIGASIPAGATSVQATITPIDDTLVEGPEDVQLTLRPGDGYALGVPSRAVMPFSDNDGPPQSAGTLALNASSYTGAEGGGAVIVTVTRSNGSSGAVGVAYATGAGNAAPGADFQPVSGILTWASGDTAPKTFSIPIVDDAAVEGPETFTVSISQPTGGATLGLATANVTITDNDQATGACGPQGNAWTANAGSYTCTGTCDPCHSPQVITVNGDIVRVTPFDANGAATFQGCGSTINSQGNTLRFFGQSNHRATLTRNGDRAFTASVQSATGGSCVLQCFR